MAQFSKKAFAEIVIRGMMAANQGRVPTCIEVAAKLTNPDNHHLYSDGEVTRFDFDEARGYYGWLCKNAIGVKPIMPPKKTKAKAAPITNASSLATLQALGLILNDSAIEGNEEDAA